MRKALFVLCVLFAVPSFAQQSSNPLQLSVFATNLGYTQSTATGSNWSGGLGAALEYRWNRHWALELQIASEQHTSRFVRIDQNGGFTADVRDVTTYPIDLLAHYRFDNASRWQPFVGAGVRHVLSSSNQLGDQTLLEIDGGVHFMITPSLSLRLDAKHTLVDDNGHFDAGLKPSIGFGWKF